MSGSSASGFRSLCPTGSIDPNTGNSQAGEIYHGAEDHSDAGSSQPADDDLLEDLNAEFDVYIMEFNDDFTTLTFYAHKYDNMRTALRTCTVPDPSVKWYAQIEGYISSQIMPFPLIKHAFR